MSNQPTTQTYPARYASLVGNHRLVGWGSYATLCEQVMARTFGFMVQAAGLAVKEYHSDLFHDAGWLRREMDDVLGNPANGPMRFMYCVRHHGTNVGDSARLMFESWNYDEALYLFEVQVNERGEWHLSIDLLDARPDRPAPVESSTDAPGEDRYLTRLKSNL